MAIHLLPSSTSSMLGSCQALTTPSSLVKELIDNAVDAKATSIDVIISANTIDKIEVRDNGYGITREDLDSLGRRGYTSKLRTFEELRIIGGSSLGFRGEALASSVSLGEVTVTTRAEGEPVAFRVKLKSTGGVLSQSSVSHPIGTTVCVSNFLSNLPVRRQTSIRDAAKTVSKIKSILQSYALARQYVRFTFKVAKAGRGNWSYVPHPKDSIKEVVMQVVGKELAKQCIEVASPYEYISSDADAVDKKDKSTSSQITMRQPTASSSLSIEAFLLRPDSDFSISKGGQYASVDSRPVSCSRGSMKKVMSLYRQHIRAVIAKTGNEMPRDPFIYLRITCPAGSYDPNVEPAKDDVLFGDENFILSVAEELFKSVYSSNNLLEEDPFTEKLKPKLDVSHNTITESGADVSKTEKMTGSKTQTNHGTGEGLNLAETITETTVHNTPNNRPDMGKGFDSHLLLSANALWQSDHGAVNPRIIAKLNAPITVGTTQSSDFLTPRPLIEHVLRIDGTPPASYDELYLPGDASNRSRGNCVGRRSVAGPTQSSLDTWINEQRSFSLSKFPHDHTLQQSHNTPEVDCLPQRHHGSPISKEFGTGQTFLTGSPWSPPPTQSRSKGISRTKINKPFIPPKLVGVQRGVCKNTSEPDCLPPLDRTLANPVQGLFGTNMALFNDDIDVALDFERRKETSTRRLREVTAAAVRREAKADEVTTNEAVLETNMHITMLPDDDPRAYLMKQQKSTMNYLNGSLQGPKLKRAKTMLLPLESIPNASGTHNLISRVSIDTLSVSRTICLLLLVDDYTKSGTRGSGLELTDSDAREVEKSLSRLMTLSLGHLALTW